MKLSPRRTWTLGLQFPLTVVAIVAGVGFTIGAVMVHQDWARIRLSLEEKALLLARSVAVVSSEAILRAMILDTEGRVLAHLYPGEHPVGLPLAPVDESDKALMAQALRSAGPRVIDDVRGDRFVEGIAPVYAEDKRLGVMYQNPIDGA